MFHIEAIDHVGLLVQDMERAMKWYQEVLGMERRYQEVWTGKRDPVVMAAGTVQVALFLPASAEHLLMHDANEHFALRVDRANFEHAKRHLEERGIPCKLWDHKICYSLYFFDPDGNQIEVTTFEVDQAQP
jgi:catechol-2,3-dioxygenase